MQEHAAAADRRWDELMLGALVLFALDRGSDFLVCGRIVTGGELVIMGANLVPLRDLDRRFDRAGVADRGGGGPGFGRRRRELRRAL